MQHTARRSFGDNGVPANGNETITEKTEDDIMSTAPWDTARIREGFIDDGGLSEYHDPINGAQTQRRVAGDIFDTWLAAHDAEVAAAALEQAALIAVRIREDYWDERTEAAISRIVDEIRAAEAGPS